MTYVVPGGSAASTDGEAGQTSLVQHTLQVVALSRLT
jgi:hypothetical protein